MLYFDVNDKNPFGVTLVTAAAVGEESHDSCDDGSMCVTQSPDDDDGDDDNDDEDDDDDDSD